MDHFDAFHVNIVFYPNVYIERKVLYVVIGNVNNDKKGVVVVDEYEEEMLIMMMMMIIIR
jgi:hypothetical protein